MTAVLFELGFVAVIIAAVVSYFVRRKKKLERMALRDKIDDMFHCGSDDR